MKIALSIGLLLLAVLILAESSLVRLHESSVNLAAQVRLAEAHKTLDAALLNFGLSSVHEAWEAGQNCALRKCLGREPLPQYSLETLTNNFAKSWKECQHAP